MSLDLNKLANKLDKALSNETSETLNKFLTDKRMSNNKQSMKLYTEAYLSDFIDRNGCIVQSDLDENQLTAIELPSDEEIDAMGKDVIIYNDTKRGWFIEGLKFMRDKIQGGNNEQQ